MYAKNPGGYSAFQVTGIIEGLFSFLFFGAGELSIPGFYWEFFFWRGGGGGGGGWGGGGWLDLGWDFFGYFWHWLVRCMNFKCL